MKGRLLTITILILFLMLPSFTIVHGLYVSSLPSNVIYADDFENYTANQKLGCNNTQGYPDGWGWVDCAAGGTSNITANVYFSCCKSLVTGSPTAAGAVFDVDKRFDLANTTRYLQVSLWFAISKSYVLENLNNAHISLETWDTGNRYEAALFLYSSNTGTCNPGIKIDFVLANTNNFVGSDHVATTQGGTLADCLLPYDVATAARGIWHHYTIVVNVVTLQAVSASVDSYDLTSLVAGLYFSNHAGGGDVECALCRPTPWRFEIGAVNAATHNLPADTWGAWHDDLIISDVTSVTSPLVQFGIIGATAWLPLLFALAGVNTTMTVWGFVLRFLKGGVDNQRWLARHVKELMLGNFAIIVFIIVLIIGANLIGPSCPRGAVCNG